MTASHLRATHQRLKLSALAAVLLLSVSGPALAQVSLDEPLDEHAAKRLDRMEKAVKEIRAIVFQGRETGAPVVVQPADTQGQLAAQGDKINDIAQTLARITGSLDQIRHDLDQNRQETSELRAANAALRERVAALEAAQKAPPPPPPGAVAGGSAAATPQDPAAAFAAAKAAYDAGDLAGAEAGFKDFVDHHGDGPIGPEARYYLAKTLIARQDWPDAATAEIGALRGWPRARWAPDAVLDLSRSLVALGKLDDACQTLGELTRRYPKALPSVVRAAAAVRAKAQCS